MVRKIKMKRSIIQKEVSGNFVKFGLSKIRDPWMWYAWVKGVMGGGIFVYLYLQGWPF